MALSAVARVTGLAAVDGSVQWETPVRLIPEFVRRILNRTWWWGIPHERKVAIGATRLNGIRAERVSGGVWC
jgi:hypothetical protein